MALVETVCGPMDGSALGVTLMHEHILCDLRDPAARDADETPADISLATRFEVDYFSNRHQPNMWLDDDAVAAAELQRYRAAGGNSVVELTVGGIRPQPLRLKALSEATGVAIILGAGYYVDLYLDAPTRALDEDALEAVLRSQLFEGAWQTDVRAGLIGEIGCSFPLMPFERRQLIAAAKVQADTGVAITIHPGRHPDAPREIADILVAHGAEPHMVVIGHMDRTIFDRDRLIALLKRGFVLEWDFFGIETSQYWMPDADIDLPTDYMRIDLIKNLAAAGYGSQLAVSHDICTRTRLSSYGGHGYGHLPRHILPMMRRRGIPDRTIETLMRDTPQRLLATRTG